MASRKSFTLNGTGDAGIGRGDGGRFVRVDATPPNPVQDEQDGKEPDRWAPKIGQNSAAAKSETIPWPEADQPTADGPRKSPMRLR